MSNTPSNRMEEWNAINWRKLEKVVYKLQKRIYKASQRGDTKVVHKLQKTLMRSRSGKTLAVRRVTQDNKGKVTAGVDGIKTLAPKERLNLVKTMKFNVKVKPTRRVWIPKPGKTEKRPLGIPTIHDRANQALVKLALEPEWEAKFEPNSYGFRPGRNAQDAVAAIFSCIINKEKWVLDADISKCFDRINHKKLLNKINTFPSLRKIIKEWLKAGVLDNGVFSATESGTPQGGVISPLLANIALHGMETLVEEYCKSKKYHRTKPVTRLIRYADDFVVITPELQYIDDIRKILSDWLADMGLELNQEKTRVAETLLTGFDFLGFNFQHSKVGKCKSPKNPHKKILGFTTHIRPSREAINRHYRKIATRISELNSVPQETLITQLNPLITGWANYYQTVSCSEVFNKLDHKVFLRLARWARRRHPQKPWSWVRRKYWHTIGTDNWAFFHSEGNKKTTLKKHRSTKSVDYIKVRGECSPFDGNLKYWSTRKGSNPMLPTRVSKLLKKQKGTCNHCGLFFREDDVLEVDHIIPKHKKGKDVYANLQLLHRHCHDVKTANDMHIDFDFIEL